MKNPIRASLVVVALAATLGMTGCNAGASQPAGNSSGESATVSADPEVKVKGFMTPMMWSKEILSSAWKDSGGWYSNTGGSEQPVIAAGDYMAYLDYGDFTTSNSKSDIQGSLIVTDGKGNQVYAAKKPEGFQTKSSKLNRVSKDGKGYIVYIESGLTSENLNSAKKQGDAAGTSVVTVIDETGKEVFSKTLSDGERAYVGSDERSGATSHLSRRDDSVRVTSKFSSGVPLSDASQVIDVATGDVSPAPTLAGSDWVGRFDGVDLFGTKSTLTNGKWTTEVANGSVSKFGNFVQTSSSGLTIEAHVLDPHTGKLSDVFVAEGVRGLQKNGHLQTDATSPNGNYILSWAAMDDPVIVDLANNKMIQIDSDVSFDPRAVNDHGDVYGKSGTNNTFAIFNVDKGGLPKLEPGATAIPTVVSSSGLGAFSDGDDGTYFVTKK